MICSLDSMSYLLKYHPSPKKPFPHSSCVYYSITLGWSPYGDIDDVNAHRLTMSSLSQNNLLTPFTAFPWILLVSSKLIPLRRLSLIIPSTFVLSLSTYYAKSVGGIYTPQSQYGLWSIHGQGIVCKYTAPINIRGKSVNRRARDIYRTAEIAPLQTRNSLITTWEKSTIFVFVVIVKKCLSNAYL